MKAARAAGTRAGFSAALLRWFCGSVSNVFDHHGVA
jgi:hypothetical protein